MAPIPGAHPAAGAGPATVALAIGKVFYRERSRPLLATGWNSLALWMLITLLDGWYSPATSQNVESKTMSQKYLDAELAAGYQRNVEAAEEIAKLLDPELRRSGYVRNGLRWYRYESESVLVIDVQPAKHRLGPYLNLGVYYFKYGHADKPSIEACHVLMRLKRIVPNPLREMELLDLPNGLSESIRQSELVQMFVTYGFPWLESVSTIESAKVVFADKNKPLALVVEKEVRADLNLK